MPQTLLLLRVLISNGPDEFPGHLVMFPNLRDARRFAVVKILEKLLVEKSLKGMWRSPREFANLVTKKWGGRPFLFDHAKRLQIMSDRL
ncbi:hypothetical protein [Paraburkholderia sp. RL17-337-BIB-A]|uniref:hypothetical protein n=1 Tax=Paraburkholderia sp. RL17-337-BIB-A TaxID=3031636 RepID=UPI0038BD3862